jgi:DNA primase
MRVIKRFAKKILFLLDGDDAGINAMLRALPLVIQHEIDSMICILPKDEDADSFLLGDGAHALLKRIENARDLFEYYIEFHEAKNLSITQKSVLAKNITDIVEKASNSVMKDLYLQKAARILKVEMTALRSLMEKGGAAKIERRGLREEPVKKEGALSPLEKMLVKTVLFRREYLKKLFDSSLVPYFASQKCKDLLNYLHEKEAVESSITELLAHDDSEAFRDIITELSLDDEELNDETIDVLFNSAIEKFRRKITEVQNKKLQRSIEEAESVHDEELLHKLLIQKQERINKLCQKDKS